MKAILAFDIGTSGMKGVLYDEDGVLIKSVYNPYKTFFPHIGWHEQRPEDWWRALVKSTRELLSDNMIAAEDISCIALTGFSMGVVPINKNGELLREYVPIWSDVRAKEAESRKFFCGFGRDEWYSITGNDAPGTYAIFKILWYLENEQDMIHETYKILGNKDYINYRLTGRIATDHSYASSSGVYDLKKMGYSEKLLGDLKVREYLPDIVYSTDVLGNLTRDAAQELGLTRHTLVVAGGVDNACMALGAMGTQEGSVYANLGSSAWIAVTSAEPILNTELYTNVFAHVIPQMFVSAVMIFSAGNAFRWVRDTLFSNSAESENSYDRMTDLASESVVGAHKLIFNPTLSSGTPYDYSPYTKGAFTGLDLGHTRADLVRAAMEGIAMSLGRNLQKLKQLYPLPSEILLAGGGSNSALWRQIYADVFRMNVICTNVGQDAGALGAAAAAAVGTGIWSDFGKIEKIHSERTVIAPVAENVEKYEKIMEVFEFVAKCQGQIGDELKELKFDE